MRFCLRHDFRGSHVSFQTDEKKRREGEEHPLHAAERLTIGFPLRGQFATFITPAHSLFRRSAGMRKCGALAQNAILLARGIIASSRIFSRKGATFLARGIISRTVLRHSARREEKCLLAGAFRRSGARAPTGRSQRSEESPRSPSFARGSLTLAFGSVRDDVKKRVPCVKGAVTK